MKPELNISRTNSFKMWRQEKYILFMTKSSGNIRAQRTLTGKKEDLRKQTKMFPQGEALSKS